MKKSLKSILCLCYWLVQVEVEEVITMAEICKILANGLEISFIQMIQFRLDLNNSNPHFMKEWVMKKMMRNNKEKKWKNNKEKNLVVSLKEEVMMKTNKTKIMMMNKMNKLIFGKSLSMNKAMKVNKVKEERKRRLRKRIKLLKVK